MRTVQKSAAAEVAEATTSAPEDVQEETLYRFFLEPGQTDLTVRNIAERLQAAGILADDPRAKDVFARLNAAGGARATLSVDEFRMLFAINPSLFRRVVEDSLAIPDWNPFCRSIGDIFHEAGRAKGGKVAAYIPELARVPADKFGLSICSVDGQRAHYGDAEEPFSIQSISKTVSYCLACEEVGAHALHQRIGREPSGHSFNAITLDAQRRPHNPMINAGAIASCSLIKSDQSASTRFAHVFDVWKQLTADRHVSFNNTVFLSERDSADRNFALAYFLRENAALPAGTSITATLDFYFQCCSVELTCDSMAVAAATLANGGVNPLTGERVFSTDTVKNCLSLMHSCGMYDFSGEFAFLIGVPAKSGVGGGIMVVIPKVLGLCVWSPPLDEHGNSVRGIEFCTLLTSKFSFHNFDIVSGASGEKIDPTRRKAATANARIVDLCWAAAKGDTKEIQRLVASGIDINGADYDGRTALHIAASEGQAVAVQYILQNGGNRDAKDRWGNTPLKDARRSGNAGIAELFND
ncbi:glutaminase A [Paraburkholderia sp. SARCC-3016]|uniref:glutaminase A n=1 Tax=Paraburkholderia sp. SARCC-3016 TaxID=3058611 RepID=UPI00280997E1|nr:glutaminase A [Paraburkholderia sp. SARCC-3016]MDQ7976906.1 glutaminase A [Paraburkholderia sp. SARCC-3016]